MKPSTLLAITSVIALTACAAPIVPDEEYQSVSSASVSSANPDITVSEPDPNVPVSSPLTVTGEARGGWYFEASFPVKLLDAGNNVIAQGPAQAQGDWMTPNFVPFSVILTFPPQTPQMGTLVLEKDNPSGEPQNDASVSIPVQL